MINKIAKGQYDQMIANCEPILAESIEDYKKPPRIWMAKHGGLHVGTEKADINQILALRVYRYILRVKTEQLALKNDKMIRSSSEYIGSTDDARRKTGGYGTYGGIATHHAKVNMWKLGGTC